MSMDVKWKIAVGSSNSPNGATNSPSFYSDMGHISWQSSIDFRMPGQQ